MIARSKVFLNQEAPIATVEVSNSGSGILNWATVTTDEALVIVDPGSSDLRVGDGLVFIRVPTGFDFDLHEGESTTVQVVDLNGITQDSQSITVTIPEPASEFLILTAFMTLAALRNQKTRRT